MSAQQPILPAAPWYTSEVYWLGAIGVAAQLVSGALRIIGRFTEVSITTDLIDAVAADLTQMVAIGFGFWTLKARTSSVVAPLTLSAGSAALKNTDNPPLFKADPTKVTP